MNRKNYEQRADAFLGEVLTEHFDVGAGLKDTLELTPIYERYADLFTVEMVRARLVERETPAGRYLADFVVGEYLENQVKDLTEEIANAELAATLPWDGKTVAYQEVPGLLMNEADRYRRNTLAQLYHSRQAEFNPKRILRFNRLHDWASRLGFADYVAAYDELRSLNLKWLAEQMAWLLDVTEKPFDAELNARLAEIDVPREEAGIWDVAIMFRALELDPLFPADRMLPALKRTLAGMGIDLDAQSNVLLDTEPRPLKSPRAFCCDVRAPTDVRLVIKPIGGVDDYRALFHEAGHAEHYAHVDVDLEFAYRRLGDWSVTETFAYLLEHLVLNAAWLEGVMGWKPAEYEPAIRAFRFSQLWLLRRYAAKINYELELHAGLVDGKAKSYVHWLRRGCRVRIPPQRYLADVDDGFYAAQYLRAWMFEAQLREHMERTFGAEWFANRAAGEFLKGLWRIGQQHTIEELAHRIGVAALGVNPLIRQLTSP
jgi:hypothetical protein